MSYPIFDSPIRTMALGVFIFAGASMITALVGRHQPNRWLLLALVAATGALWIVGGNE